MTERQYEKFLRMVIERSIGVPVFNVDDGSENGKHDAEIRYPDGRIAGVEFTTVGEPAALQMQSFPMELPVPSTPFWWTLRYPPKGVSYKAVREHVPLLIRLMDQRGFRNADDLGDELAGLPAWEWFADNELSLSNYGPTTKSRGGRVDLLPDGMGGVVDGDFVTLNPWVESLQAELWWTEKVAKLVRSGHEELHLGLRVHETGIPFPILSAIHDGGPVNVGDPAGMDPLAHLWLVTSYGTNVVHWSRSGGWEIRSYVTPEEKAATDKRNSDALKKILEGAERALDRMEQQPE